MDPASTRLCILAKRLDPAKGFARKYYLVVILLGLIGLVVYFAVGQNAEATPKPPSQNVINFHNYSPKAPRDGRPAEKTSTASPEKIAMSTASARSNLTPNTTETSLAPTDAPTTQAEQQAPEYS